MSAAKNKLIYPEIPPAGPGSSNDEIKHRAKFGTKVMDYLKFTIYDPEKSNPYNYIKSKRKSQGAGEKSFSALEKGIGFQGGRKEGDSTQGIWRTVYLYLPHQLNEQYSTNYNRSALGPFGNSLLGAAEWAENNIIDKDGNMDAGGFGAELLQAGAKVRGKQAIFQAITGAFNGASAFTGGSVADKDALSALQNKRVFNPYEETTFKGVRYRSHSFNFDMQPRNYSEMRNIQNIIDVLRFAMLPTKTGSNDEWLSIPKFFKTDIVRYTPAELESGQGMDRLSRPQTLTKIMQFPVKMVLTDMQLNLTPNGQNTSLRSYNEKGEAQTEDYGPGSYKMTLRFDETAFLTNDLIWSELNDDQNKGTGVFGEEAPRYEFDPVTAAALKELANK